MSKKKEPALEAFTCRNGTLDHRSNTGICPTLLLTSWKYWFNGKITNLSNDSKHRLHFLVQGWNSIPSSPTLFPRLFRLKLLLSILPFEERTVNILILMSIIILSVPTLVIFPYRMLTCPIRAFGQSAVDSRECDNRLFRVLSQIIRGTGYTSFAQVSILLYWTYL